MRERGVIATEAVLEGVHEVYYDRILRPAPAFITAQRRIGARVAAFAGQRLAKHFGKCRGVHDTEVQSQASQWMNYVRRITNQRGAGRDISVGMASP